MSDPDRGPFVCSVSGVECHGTIRRTTMHRSDPHSPDLEYAHYSVGVIVAGLRNYTFDMLPVFKSKRAVQYACHEFSRMSFLRAQAVEAIRVGIAGTGWEYPAELFDFMLKECVVHYKTFPPKFQQPTDEARNL